jgi:tetratricopeptide (TPR) repeat protein
VESSPTSARSIAEHLDGLRISRGFSEAEEIGHRALAEGVADTAIRIALGRIELLRNRPNEALNYFEDAVHADPSSGTAIAWKIAALCRLRRFDDAQKASTEALVRFSSQVDVLITVGRLQLDRNRYEEAPSWFERALQLDPRNSTALEWRVTALRSLRRFEDTVVSRSSCKLADLEWAVHVSGCRGFWNEIRRQSLFLLVKGPVTRRAVLMRT